MPTQIGENHSKKTLKANELVGCMGVNQLRTPNIAMIAARAGFDAVYISTSSTTRPRFNRRRGIRRGIGYGDHADRPGPPRMTRTMRLASWIEALSGSWCRTSRKPPGARAIVEACLYAPKGHRSAFGSGPQLGYAAIPQAEVCRVLNEQTLLMAMIETPEAVENADPIAAVDGIDVLHIGASDLSTEMGIPGQYTHERMRAAFETVARAAKGHGKAMGVGGVRQDFEFQSWLLRLGVRYLTGGSDVGYILSAGRADVKQLRELKL